MAVRLEFINLIIPIEAIDRVYRGGFKKYVEDEWSAFGERLWHDGHLFRDGAMNPLDMEELVRWWEWRGLTAMEKRDGRTYWKDMCVVDFLSGPTLACDWLAVDMSDQSVYLRSRPKGKVIGREEMQMLMKPASLDSLFASGHLRLDRGKLFDAFMPPKRKDFDFDRVDGMLLGVAIGDSLGKTTESMLPAERSARYGTIRDYLPYPELGGARGFPSDDTQLTFWTLDQLIEDGRLIPSNLAKRFAEGGRIYGLGSTVREFLANVKSGRPWQDCGPESAGNGAIMRIAPILVPHLRTGGRRLWADVAMAAMLTHNDRASTSACLAFCAMLWELLDMAEPPAPNWWVDRYVELARDLEGETQYSTRGGSYPNYRGPLWRFVQQVVPHAFAEKMSVVEACSRWYSGAYLLETIPSVLYILMCHAQDPEEAIIRAVNDTKDNDSIAAIVGAAVGALHGQRGLPHRWIKNLSGRTTADDEGRVFELLAKAREVFWESGR